MITIDKEALQNKINEFNSFINESAQQLGDDFNRETTDDPNAILLWDACVSLNVGVSILNDILVQN